jgi:hypothetical protein
LYGFGRPAITNRDINGFKAKPSSRAKVDLNAIWLFNHINPIPSKGLCAFNPSDNAIEKPKGKP